MFYSAWRWAGDFYNNYCDPVGLFHFFHPATSQACKKRQLNNDKNALIVTHFKTNVSMYI